MLSTMDLSLLDRGLSFCPTANFDPFHFEVEMYKFERLLKLKDFFHKIPAATTPSPEPENLSRFKLKSRFVPPGQFHTIDNFIRTVKHDVNNKAPREFRTNNLNSGEIQALKSLKEDKTIIIKPADKGGAIVVMDYSKYRYGMINLLSDNHSYIKLVSNPWPIIRNKLKTLIDIGKGNGWFNEKLCEFLYNEHPQTPVLYGLPKIHKGLEPLQFRPIVSGSGSITQPLAQLLDHYLQPLVISLPAYIKDTSDFLDKLEPFRQFQSGWLLASMDISSLYTSIPNDAGIQAVNFFMSKTTIDGPPSDFVSECLDFILSNNCFRFEGDLFSQIRGTAMGSSAAPAFANLFMGYLEENFIYPSDLFTRHVKIWTRFIDDVFLIWEGDTMQFSSFVCFLNGIFRDIVFNPVISDTDITFLDVSITITQNTLKTSLFVKPTDRNTLLHASSSHPSHLKHSIPISQFKRVIRICSEATDREKQLDKMYKKFLDRGYTCGVLDVALKRALEPQHPDPPKSLHLERPLFVQCFNRASSVVKAAVHDNQKILCSDPHIPMTLKRPPVHAYKRSNSLRDMLVQADPRKKYAKNPITISNRKGCYKCHSCNICNSLISGTSFNHPQKGFPYPINGYYNCNTDMCVYILKCPCGLAYVGKTTGAFKVRFQKHRSDIRIALEKNRKGETIDVNKPVAVHFVTLRHQTHDLRGMIIDQVPRPSRGGDRDQFLLRREAYWIYTLDTVRPKGLNTMLSLSCFLPDR